MICSACRELAAVHGCSVAGGRCNHPLVKICGLTYRRRGDGTLAVVRAVPVGRRVDGNATNMSVSTDGTIVLGEIDEYGDVRQIEHHEPDLETFRSRWERVERGWVAVPEV